MKNNSNKQTSSETWKFSTVLSCAAQVFSFLLFLQFSEVHIMNIKSSSNF